MAGCASAVKRTRRSTCVAEPGWLDWHGWVGWQGCAIGNSCVVSKLGSVIGSHCSLVNTRLRSCGTRAGGEVDTVMAGAAGDDAGLAHPVVAIGRLVRVGGDAVSLERVAVMAQRAVLHILRKAHGVETHGGLFDGVASREGGADAGGIGRVVADAVQVVTGLGETATHVELVNHAREGEGGLAINRALVRARESVGGAFSHCNKRVLGLIGVAGHAQARVVAANEHTTGNAVGCRRGADVANALAVMARCAGVLDDDVAGYGHRSTVGNEVVANVEGVEQRNRVGYLNLIRGIGAGARLAADN